jgi:hypothetical protein
VFGARKAELSGRKFWSDEEVQKAVHDWLHKQPKEIFQKGFRL